MLVIDVGGTHVKVLATGHHEPREIPSGLTMTPDKMVRDVKRIAGDWKYDRVTIGYPGPVIHGRPLREPHNVGPGWVGFNFRKAFGCPVKVTNDAAMQALGSYQGGRMLFLGLGTGLGAAMIVNGILEPMELAPPCSRRRRTAQGRSRSRIRGAWRRQCQAPQKAASGYSPGRQPKRVCRGLSPVGNKDQASVLLVFDPGGSPAYEDLMDEVCAR